MMGWLQSDAMQNYIVLHSQTAYCWCRLGFLVLDFSMWLLMGYCWSLYHIFLWGALCRTNTITMIELEGHFKVNIKNTIHSSD